uniref:Uncharacterized protein n=1 Tax=Lepeophtheirus salmonis TaxID=72036 RepID=A0A0K2UF85_LEPSM
MKNNNFVAAKINRNARLYHYAFLTDVSLPPSFLIVT